MVSLLRFFYENIWREWDEDEDGDYSYVARYLEARLQLYHDIKEGNLPKDLVNRYGGKIICDYNVLIIGLSRVQFGE